MSVTVAIDPGKRKAGIAVAVEGKIVHAGTVTVGHPPDLALALWSEAKAALKEQRSYWPVGSRVHVVQEIPVDYPGKTRRAEDLESLRVCNESFWELRHSLLPGASVALHRYAPAAWKGGLPKVVHHRRIRGYLVSPEPWPIGHDARDAIGLVLFYLGRTGRGGARPR